MSRDLGRDVPDLEKLYARKLWADFSHPKHAEPLTSCSSIPRPPWPILCIGQDIWLSSFVCLDIALWRTPILMTDEDSAGACSEGGMRVWKKRQEQNLAKDTPPKKGIWTPPPLLLVRFQVPAPSGVFPLQAQYTKSVTNPGLSTRSPLRVQKFLWRVCSVVSYPSFSFLGVEGGQPQLFILFRSGSKMRVVPRGKAEE